MSSHVRRNLNEKAVLYRNTQVYSGSGKPTLSDPEEIICRWIDGRVESVDRRGNTVALDATVIVAEAIPVGSELIHSAYDDWVGTGSAGTDDDVYIVKQAKRIPTIKARDNRYKLMLARKSDLTGA